MKTRLYIPENLDLESTLSILRSEKWIKKNKYRYMYILSTIHLNRVTNKTYKKDDFIPLHYKRLRAITSQRLTKQYLIDLISVGVIEKDNHYVNGRKSIGYRYTEKYRYAKTKAFVNEDNHISKKQEQFRKRLEVKTQKQPNHISRLLECLKGVELDYFQARSNLNFHYDEDSDAHIQSSMAIDLIEDKQWHFHRDEFGGRLHTNLTNLPKILRENLLVRDEFTQLHISLTELDIKTSQPLFFLIYLTKQTEYEIPMKELGEYSKIVYKGFYSFFMDELNVYDRDRVKTNVFKYLFYKRYHDENQTRYERLFEQRFPNIFKAIVQMKKEYGHNQLAKHLQRMEAEFIIDDIAKEYTQKHPIDFIATIHDSIIVNARLADQYKGIMEKKLKSLIGFTPTIHSKVLTRPQSQTRTIRA